jgi:hypothetical protein
VDINKEKWLPPEGRIGNVSEEISAFLAPLMDNSFGSVACVGDNTNYASGYYFSCLLAYEDFNHSPQGYALAVIVFVLASFVLASNYMMSCFMS